MESDGPPVRIVFWTRWFNGFMFDGNDLEIGRECPIPPEYKDVPELATRESPWCVITPSRENVQSATAVLFHAADYFPNEVPSRIENQPWILETQESPLTALFRTDDEKMKVFDYLASYHLKSTFLFSYYSPAIMDVANRPLPDDFMASKTSSAPILWIARNCGASSGRQHYVKELMKYIKVDSYGSCLNNRKFPNDKSREELMREYKFYLAIENANCDDYVTEKLYDTFLASAVPIVDGPASYDGFIPTKGSVIRMDAYPDPRDLARYIDYLDKNDTAYLEHLSYRRDALDVSARERLEPSFIGNWSDPEFHNKRSSWCSVCRGMLPWWQARRSGAKSSPDPIPRNDRFIVDGTCTPPGKWNYAKDGPPYVPDWSPSIPDLQLLPTDDHIVTLPDTKVPDRWRLNVEDSPLIVWTIATVSGFAFVSFISFYIYRHSVQRNKLKKLADALPR